MSGIWDAMLCVTTYIKIHFYCILHSRYLHRKFIYIYIFAYDNCICHIPDICIENLNLSTIQYFLNLKIIIRLKNVRCKKKDDRDRTGSFSTSLKNY